MYRHRRWGHPHWGPPGCGFMSVEDEVTMLEKAKEHLEAQLENINARLEKLKE